MGLVIYCALMTATHKRHGGVHGWDLTKPQANEAIYWFNATSIEYAPVILCTKLTVLLLYRRVFLPHRGSVFDNVLRAFMVICSVYYLTTIIVKIWECTPRAKIWNQSIEGTCINVAALLDTDGVFNTLSDFIILLVPVKALWKLQMKTARKIQVVLLFTVGLIAPIFSIVGWVVRQRNATSLDITYNDPKILLWAAAELSSGLICVCLPTIPALLRRRQKTTKGSRFESIFQSRYLRNLARRQPTSSTLGDQRPLNKASLELTERYLHGGVDAMPAAVITDIEGGQAQSISELNPLDLTGGERVLVQGSAIMKTVKLEQSSRPGEQRVGG